MPKMRVYFVDDDPIILKFIQLILKDTDVESIVFEHPEQLFEKLEKDPPPDLIISDITMGEMNGFQVLSKVHQQYPELKCAYCSAYTNLDLAIETNTTNGTDIYRFPFYSKPFDKTRFLSFIKDSLENEVSSI
jgi:DNA-binding NtrC family response regulator